MNKMLVSLMLVFLLQISTFSQSLPEFIKISEIKLLESNRNDVRKILKDYQIIKPDDSLHFDNFSTANAKIEILYSDGKCNDELLDFDVSAGKVVAMHLMVITGRIKPSEIGIDLANFKRGRMYDNNIFNEDLGLVLSSGQDRIEQIYFIPPKESFSLLCPNKNKPEFATARNYFYQLQRQKEFRLIRMFADVVELNLNKNEIQKNCESARQNDQFPQESQKINVSTIALNHYDDVLLYYYLVSGGKIVGTGAEVVWDLSSAKAGTYTITAAVDDGCGFCGKTITKTVNIKEYKGCE